MKCTSEQIIELLVSSFPRFGDIDMDETTKFQEIGLDSIESLKFSKIVKTRYEIKIKYSELVDIITIQDMADLVQSKT